MARTMSLFVLIWAIAFWNNVAAVPCIDDRCHIDDSSLRFFVLGDFGGLPLYPYYSPAQTKVAKAIYSMGTRKRTHFQLELGDNFYFVGVNSVNDRRFRATFENIYENTGPLRNPWYFLAGNHDHYGNVSAQIEYSKGSSRWVFPAENYVIKYRFGRNTTVDFIMIDTIRLSGNTKDIRDAEFLYAYLTGSHEPQGPEDPALAERTWTWIEDQIKQSKADYLFVCGHYPMYSVGDHGPTDILIDRLEPLLHRYKVNAYLAGHDHNLQHLSVRKSDWSVEYVVSGAASRMDRSRDHEDAIPDGALKYFYPNGWNPFSALGFSNGAFVYAELNNQGGQFMFYNGKGKHKYSFTLKPRNIKELESTDL